MPMPKHRHRPKADRRRALELLASCRDGCTEAIMLAHGFTVPQMVGLVRAGLATATAERMVAGNRKIEVARVRTCWSLPRLKEAVDDPLKLEWSVVSPSYTFGD
jgi:hypothetical protein